MKIKVIIIIIIIIGLEQYAQMHGNGKYTYFTK